MIKLAVSKIRIIAAIAIAIPYFSPAIAQSEKVWYKPGAFRESFKLARDGCAAPTRDAFEACMSRAGWTLVDRSKGDESRRDCGEKFPASSANIKTRDLYFECMREKGWEDEPASNRELRKWNIKFEDEVCQKPEFAQAIKNMPCRVREITLEHLSNAEKVTDENKRLYLNFFKILDEEFPKYDQILRNGSMSQKKIYEYRISNINPRTDDNRIALINGQISFGEYNKRRKDMDVEMQKFSLKVEDEIKEFANSPPKRP
jgi:hypothetical protein